MNIDVIITIAVPATYFLMYAVERCFPAREFPKFQWWGLVGLGFLTLSVVAPLLFPLEWLDAHRLIDGTKLGVIGGIAVGFVGLEVCLYGYHRACHRFSFMWRAFHQMHHGAQRLDIPSSVVGHPMELLIQNIILNGVTVFVLGLEPIAAALVGYLFAFCGLFQHWNIKTPRWVGYIIQRPEAHGIHHQYNVHAYNYADLSLVDMVFGTFKNPAAFTGRVGFEQKPSFGKMFVGIDMSRGTGTRSPAQMLSRETAPVAPLR